MPTSEECCRESNGCTETGSVRERGRNDSCNFDYMKPVDEDTIKRLEETRQVFKTAEQQLRAILNPSRETSLCWTSLEQACNAATKGICLDEKFGVPPTRY